MCKQCELKSVYEFTNQRKLCKLCFIHWFEKKVLYTIRKFGMIKSGEVVGYCRGKDVRSAVLENVLKMFAGKGRVEVVKGGQGTKIALPDTLDSVSYNIVEEIINGKVKELEKFKPVCGKVIRPLCLFLDKEVLLYAKLRGLKYSAGVPPTLSAQLINFINELEIKHPEIKNAIVNGWLKMSVNLP